MESPVRKDRPSTSTVTGAEPPFPKRGRSQNRRSRWRRRFWLLVAVLFILPLLLPRRLYWQAARPLFHVDIVDQYAAAYGFDPLFIMALVRVESSFARSARSSRGAMGLMQLMPDTAAAMARQLGLDPLTVNLEDPATNIRLGVHYLSVLRGEFGDDRLSLLAAYNAGPTKARSWRKGPRLTLEDVGFAETRRLIERVDKTEEWLRRLQKLKRTLRA